jgi:hypothetical protein
MRRKVSHDLLVVAHRDGDVSCLVEVWLDDLPEPPALVIVEEIPDNSGVPISVAMDEISDQVRHGLQEHDEPIWVERWASRALASVVLSRSGVTTHMRAQRHADGWRRQPMTAGDLELLLLGSGGPTSMRDTRSSGSTT